MAVLAARKPKNPEAKALVFCTRSGAPLNRRNLLRRQLTPTCKQLKLVGIHWHSLRHSNATSLDAVGTPLGTVQALLGHASPQITSGIYLHSLPAGARNAVEKVEEFLLGPKWTQMDPKCGNPKTGTYGNSMSRFEIVGRGERI
jgi:integrase